jgi:hypothetical protein
MSTGITILNASYGNANGSVDVTKSTVGFIKNGILSIPPVSATSLNITDPVPGQPKKLTISYSINGGSTIVETINDNEPFFLDAPPQRLADGLVITKAQYGYTGNFTDVTDVVQNQLNNGSIKLKVGFKELGLPDPNPNKQKQLNVEYTINGSPNKKAIKDGDSFIESAPATQAPDNTTPSQHVKKTGSLLFGTLLSAIGYILFFASFFTTIRVSDDIFGSKWAAIIGLVPGAAYWLLPFIVLVKRLFTTTDSILLSTPSLKLSELSVIGTLVNWLGGYEGSLKPS